MEIYEKFFVYPEEIRMVCEAFEIDPVAAISEGSLLITARPDRSKGVLLKLRSGGINASIVGKVTDDAETRIMERRDGTITSLEMPEQDPFWPTFFDQMTADSAQR
jgi:hydrogenase maturation factor